MKKREPEILRVCLVVKDNELRITTKDIGVRFTVIDRRSAAFTVPDLKKRIILPSCLRVTRKTKCDYSAMKA